MEIMSYSEYLSSILHEVSEACKTKQSQGTRTQE